MNQNPNTVEHTQADRDATQAAIDAEERENTLCICGAQNCTDHAAHEVANEHKRADITWHDETLGIDEFRCTVCGVIYPGTGSTAHHFDEFCSHDCESQVTPPPSLKGRFDMDLTREQALFLMAAGLSECPLWSLMSYEYGRDQKPDDDDTWEGITDDDLESIREDPSYTHFALWLTPQPSKVLQ